MRRDPLTTVLRRQFNKELTRPRNNPRLPPAFSSAPIIAAAIDLAEGSKSIDHAILVTARRMLATLPSARLACLNVLKQGRLTIDFTLDEQGHNRQIDRLVGLRDWAEPLTFEEGHLTVHALEAVDPAAAILEFAQNNRISRITDRRAAELHRHAHAGGQRIGRKSPPRRFARSPWFRRVSSGGRKIVIGGRSKDGHLWLAASRPDEILCE